MKQYIITIKERGTENEISRTYAERLFYEAERNKIGDEIVDMYEAIRDKEVEF